MQGLGLIKVFQQRYDPCSPVHLPGVGALKRYVPLGDCELSLLPIFRPKTQQDFSEFSVIPHDVQMLCRLFGRFGIPKDDV